MPNHNWGAEPERRPTIPADVEILADEPGRITEVQTQAPGIDCRSHWFVLVRPKFGAPTLLVSHGAGEDSVELGHGWRRELLNAVLAMTSDARFLLLWRLYEGHRKAYRQGQEQKWEECRRAFVDGRLHKRKMPGRDAHNVWIDPAPPANPPVETPGAPTASG